MQKCFFPMNQYRKSKITDKDEAEINIKLFNKLINRSIMPILTDILPVTPLANKNGTPDKIKKCNFIPKNRKIMQPFLGRYVSYIVSTPTFFFLLKKTPVV